MPANSTFLNNRSLLGCQRLLQGLLETYRSDFPKYATRAQHRHLQVFFEKAPGLVGRHFKYVHVDPEIRSRELKVSLDLLEASGLMHRVCATSASGLPLQAQMKEKWFKLLFLDIGLLNCANKLDLPLAADGTFVPLTWGAQMEQFVGQELMAYSDPFSATRLFYWEREKPGSQAEIDYLIQVGSHILPIEVKAGTTGRLQSMNQFLREKGSTFGIRISAHPLSYHDKILSIPFYLIEQMPHLALSLIR